MTKTHDKQVEQWEDEARAEVVSESRPVAPRERPILFSADMVRAILEGRKAQTRRVIKLPMTHGVLCMDEWRPFDPSRREDHEGMVTTKANPYGQPGDRLWVRETWCPRGNGKLEMERLQRPFFAADTAHGKPDGWRWRPSIHMPRWASRLTLEVTEVRVQRLQEISEEDARAEGVACLTTQSGPTTLAGRPWATEFRLLWDSINGERPGCSWEANPFVWAISFMRLP